MAENIFPAEPARPEAGASIRPSGALVCKQLKLSVISILQSISYLVTSGACVATAYAAIAANNPCPLMDISRKMTFFAPEEI